MSSSASSFNAMSAPMPAPHFQESQVCPSLASSTTQSISSKLSIPHARPMPMPHLQSQPTSSQGASTFNITSALAAVDQRESNSRPVLLIPTSFAQSRDTSNLKTGSPSLHNSRTPITVPVGGSVDHMNFNLVREYKGGKKDSSSSSDASPASVQSQKSVTSTCNEKKRSPLSVGSNVLEPPCQLMSTSAAAYAAPSSNSDTPMSVDHARDALKVDLKSASRTSPSVDAHGVRIKKKYRKCSQRKSPTVWTELEHAQFLAGARHYGRGAWGLIAKTHCRTRTARQLASHAQACFGRTGAIPSWVFEDAPGHGEHTINQLQLEVIAHPSGQAVRGPVMSTTMHQVQVAHPSASNSSRGSQAAGVCVLPAAVPAMSSRSAVPMAQTTISRSPTSMSTANPAALSQNMNMGAGATIQMTASWSHRLPVAASPLSQPLSQSSSCGPSHGMESSSLVPVSLSAAVGGTGRQVGAGQSGIGVASGVVGAGVAGTGAPSLQPELLAAGLQQVQGAGGGSGTSMFGVHAPSQHAHAQLQLPGPAGITSMGQSQVQQHLHLQARLQQQEAARHQETLQQFLLQQQLELELQQQQYVAQAQQLDAYAFKLQVQQNGRGL